MVDHVIIFDFANDLFYKCINKYHDNDENVLQLYHSIMDGYAKMGNIKKLMSLFDDLKEKKIKIDAKVYDIVVNAYSDSGNINDALDTFFQLVENNNNKCPSYALRSIIDCLSRGNCLDEAETIYDKFKNQIRPYQNKVMALQTILSGCRTHNDQIRGERIVKLIESIHKNDANKKMSTSIYVLLSDIYESNKEFDKLDKIRQLIKKKALKQRAGKSWIEDENGKIHEFAMNDDSHQLYQQIVKERERLKKQLIDYGHMFDENVVNAEGHLCGHTQQSALIYGLITTKPNTPLKIINNRGLCPDCHKATALISKLRNRKIIVTDQKRWHIFQKGICCNG